MTTVPASDARPTRRPDRRRLEKPRAAGIAGLAFAALFITALLILNVSYLEALVLVFPAWVAAVSVVILKAGGDPAT
jgi:hypothetical protein